MSASAKKLLDLRVPVIVPLPMKICANATLRSHAGGGRGRRIIRWAPTKRFWPGTVKGNNEYSTYKVLVGVDHASDHFGRSNIRNLPSCDLTIFNIYLVVIAKGRWGRVSTSC